jgi:hypothetical protein
LFKAAILIIKTCTIQDVLTIYARRDQIHVQPFFAN